jgi:hypothetical protein
MLQLRTIQDGFSHATVSQLEGLQSSDMFFVVRYESVIDF